MPSMPVPGFDFTRREFCAAAASALAGLTVAPACAMGAGWQEAGAARLTARPKAGVATTATGSRKLGLDTSRDAILQMPANPGTAPLPLLVLLHGASGSADRQLARESSVLRRIAPWLERLVRDAAQDFELWHARTRFGIHDAEIDADQFVGTAPHANHLFAAIGSQPCGPVRLARFDRRSDPDSHRQVWRRGPYDATLRVGFRFPRHDLLG